MDALIDIRERVTPMLALTGAMAIATAAVVSAPPVQHAAERVVPPAVHEVKSLPLQLTSGVDFFAPYYYQPAGPLGTAVTVPLYVVTYAADTLVKGVTQVLTGLHVDNRLAQQPSLLTQGLLFPIATGVQGALASALDGTFVLGKFTPAQAINFALNAIKTAIEGFIAAEKALFTPSPTLAVTTKTDAKTQDVACTAIADSTPTVTLSTAKVDTAPKTVPKQKVAAATADGAAGASTDAAGDTKKADTADTVAAAKPAWKKPTLKLPTFKLPTLKFSIPKKATAGATKPESASSSDTPKASHESNDGGSQGTSK
ncbi:hypothetical protein QN239_07500 [Mycolicibacterium sp. Y3]